jgi:hypothetical protein
MTSPSLAAAEVEFVDFDDDESGFTLKIPKVIAQFSG